MAIIALLKPIKDSLSKTTLRQMSRVIIAMLVLTGRGPYWDFHVGLKMAAVTRTSSVFTIQPFSGYKCWTSATFLPPNSQAATIKNTEEIHHVC